MGSDPLFITIMCSNNFYKNPSTKKRTDFCIARGLGVSSSTRTVSIFQFIHGASFPVHK